MIKFVFTVDYEIYGNGCGSVKELIYEPAQRLKEIFDKWKVQFVVFVEAVELDIIYSHSADPVFSLIKRQMQDFYEEGFEIGLHIHPQWYNARYKNGTWLLDYSEYNLCLLPKERIMKIIDRSIEFLRRTLGVNDYSPLSFRAGNWLLQPTQAVAQVLASRGIKIDSSVFKGGLQLKNNLDYRPALKNGYYWKFSDDVNIEDSNGALLEVPIHTEMVPFWKMATSKRFNLQRKATSSSKKKSGRNGKLSRIRDFLRFRYPLKLDFCRMTLPELIRMVGKVIKEDEKDPDTFRSLVAIGHTKDLVDFETVDSFLSYLTKKQIPISTFKDIYPKCVTVTSSR